MQIPGKTHGVWNPPCRRSLTSRMQDPSVYVVFGAPKLWESAPPILPEELGSKNMWARGFLLFCECV